jgi:hypothetical protein
MLTMAALRFPYQTTVTITAEGKISGTLLHTLVPVTWQKLQLREGQLSADGSVIAGNAR